MKPEDFFEGFMIDFEFLEVLDKVLSRVVWLFTFSKEVQELCLVSGPVTERVVRFFSLKTFDLHLLTFDYDAVVSNAYAFT